MVQSYRAAGEIFTRMKGVVENSGVSGGMEFSQTNKGFELSMSSYLLFGLESGKAEILPGMRAIFG